MIPRRLAPLFIALFLAAPLQGKDTPLRFEHYFVEREDLPYGTLEALAEDDVTGWAKGWKILTDRTFNSRCALSFQSHGKPSMLLSIDTSSEKGEHPDLLYMDINQNQAIDEDEVFSLLPVGSALVAVDIPFTRTLEDSTTSFLVRAYVRPSKEGGAFDMAIMPSGYYHGEVILFGVTYEVKLTDANCNGSFGDYGESTPAGGDLLALHPIEGEETGTTLVDPIREKQLQPKMFFGIKAYDVEVKENGGKICIEPIKTGFGQVIMPEEGMEFVLHREDWGLFKVSQGNDLYLPAGTYAIRSFSMRSPDNKAQCTYRASEKMTLRVGSGVKKRIRPKTDLKPTLSVSYGRDTANLSLRLETSEGAVLSGYSAMKDGDRLNGIPFVIKDKISRTIYKGCFDFSGGGACSHAWGVAGVTRGSYWVNLEEELDLLEINTTPLRITVN